MNLSRPLKKTHLSLYFSFYHLVLVNLSLLKLCFALFLEGDDDEGNEDVDKEEGEDDEVDDVEDGHLDAVERDWSLVFVGHCHRLLEDHRPTLMTITILITEPHDHNLLGTSPDDNPDYR